MLNESGEWAALSCSRFEWEGSQLFSIEYSICCGFVINGFDCVKFPLYPLPPPRHVLIYYQENWGTDILKTGTLVNTWAVKNSFRKETWDSDFITGSLLHRFFCIKNVSAKRRNKCVWIQISLRPLILKVVFPLKRESTHPILKNILLRQDNPNWCKIFIPS